MKHLNNWYFIYEIAKESNLVSSSPDSYDGSLQDHKNQLDSYLNENSIKDICQISNSKKSLPNLKKSRTLHQTNRYLKLFSKKLKGYNKDLSIEKLIDISLVLMDLIHINRVKKIVE